MPLRVLRLLPLPTVGEQTCANSPSFASSLQIAAGRAWVRRVTAYTPSKTIRKCGIQTDVEGQVASCSSRGRKDSATLGSHDYLPRQETLGQYSRMSITRPEHCTNAGQGTSPYSWRDRLREDHPIQEIKMKTYSEASRKSRQIGKQAQGIPVTYFNPTPDNDEPPDMETCSPGDDNIDLFNEISPESRAELLPVVSDSLPSPGSHLLISPCSRESLYRNLLYLVNVRKPTAPLPSLIDYHRRYLDWQSTRSYNFLIDLSLRHRLLGITGHLFRSLKHNGLPMNIESHKLMVRCLIQQNMWEGAWDYVWLLIKRNSFPRDAKGREAIPFSIWLEFCRVPKKRRKPFGCGESSTTLEETYQLLHNITPGNIPPLHVTPPFAIFCLVGLMLRTGRQQPAVSLTTAYFRTLPRFLNRKHVLGCLRIIHSHMAHSTAKPGLPRFFDVRRTLISFLRIHPSLRPNGRTLCLLFKSLQKARKCGSIAWTQLSKFKKDWGPQVENRRVLRRVSQLALKEGRLDITKKIHAIDFASRVRRRTQLREESLMARVDLNAPGQRRRLPYRLIYPQNGKEARMWYRHRVRIRLKLLRMSVKRHGETIQACA